MRSIPGRVLAGFTVPSSERDRFEQFLNALGYPSTDESSNPVFKRFFFSISEPSKIAAVGRG